jgi:hypothetical protein
MRKSERFEKWGPGGLRCSCCRPGGFSRSGKRVTRRCVRAARRGQKRKAIEEGRADLSD